MTALDSKMLARIVCPETHQPVTLATAEVVARLNQASTEGSLKNHAGHMVNGLIEHALVRQDGKCAYLVMDGVPSMLVDERIDLS